MIFNTEHLQDLTKLNSKSLFYPCAGNDILEVLDIFVPYLDEFHFVDMLDELHYPSAHYGMRNFIRVRSRLANRYEGERFHSKKDFYFQREESMKRYPQITRERYSSRGWNERGKYTFTPLHEKEIYEVENKEISVYKYRDDGYAVFRNLVYNEEHYDRDSSDIYRYGEYGLGGRYSNDRESEKKFAVFFYRGDSQGEGGSGFYWLSYKYIREVLNSIEDGGFLVTDGSNSSDNFNRDNRDISIREKILSGEEIVVGDTKLIPLGTLRERMGSLTMVYKKVKK